MISKHKVSHGWVSPSGGLSVGEGHYRGGMDGL